MSPSPPPSANSGQKKSGHGNPYSDLEDDDSGAESEETFKCKEGLRQIRVSYKAARDKGKQGGQLPPTPKNLWTSPELHSHWSGKEISTPEDWPNLRDAAINGDDNALGYIVYLNLLYQRPDNPRSQGIAALIVGWSTILHNHKAWVEVYRQKVKAMTFSRPSDNNVQMSTPPPADPIGPDLFEGTGSNLLDDTEPYRSESPTGPDLQITNPSDPLQAAGRDWAQVPVHSWP